MDIDIRARGFSLTDALRAHCARQLAFALGRFGEHIRRVTVRLDDINGPRGGNDKRCMLVITLREGSPLALESTDADLYTAIARAADRAGQAASRRVQRGHDFHRIVLA